MARDAGDPGHVRPAAAVCTGSRWRRQAHGMQAARVIRPTRLDEVAGGIYRICTLLDVSSGGFISIRTSSLMMNLCCSTPDIRSCSRLRWRL